MPPTRPSVSASILALVVGMILFGAMPDSASAQAPAMIPSPPVIDSGFGTATDEPCRLELATPSSVVFRGAYSRGYQADDAAHVERFTITIRHLGAPCRFRLSLSTRGGSSVGELYGASSELSYKLSASELPNRSALEDVKFEGAFGAGSSVEAYSIDVGVATGQAVPAGSYAGFVDLTLYRVDDTKLEIADTTSVQVSAIVPAEVRLSIGDDPNSKIRSANVDFGFLQSGAQAQTSFSLAGNAPVDVSLRSSNRGKLQHEKGSFGIPYQVEVNGQTVSLDGDWQMSVSGSDGLLLQHYDVVFEVPEVSKAARAGSYHDTLVVTVTAQ